MDIRFPRVAYPNEVGISDPNIIEVRISTALTRRSGKGPSGKNVPTDHILKVRHRLYGWLSPWEWGMLASLSRVLEESLGLIKSFLRTEIGVIVFTLTGSIGIIYIFYGDQITRAIMGMIGYVGDIPNPADALKDFFADLIPQLPGFPDITPFVAPPLFDEAGNVLFKGSANFVDAAIGLFTGLFGRLQRLVPRGEGQQPVV